jgi:non-ribosomal peptide synthetase component F
MRMQLRASLTRERGHYEQDGRMWGMPDRDANAPERFRCFAERIVGHAEAEPDRILISEPGHALTGGEFAGLVARLARALEACGLGRGMRVAILATISPEALAAGPRPLGASPCFVLTPAIAPGCVSS